jgi:LPS sulfotransferase NodH
MGGFFHNLRHPRRCYLVCAIARSGSNLLTDGLHATRRAGRPKQFFLPKFETEYGARHDLNASEDFAGYVRGVLRKTATSNEVFGFKVMGWYLEEFLGRLRATGAFGGAEPSERVLLNEAFPRLKFVQILRRNKLRQAISKAKALQSGLWKIQEGNEAAVEPHFDGHLIARCLEETRRNEAVWARFFERNMIEPFAVHYEDLCEDYEGTLLELLSFLKIRLPRGEKISPPRTIRQADALSCEWEQHYLALRV